MRYAACIANHLLKCSHVIKLLLCLQFLTSKLYLNTTFRNFAKAPKMLHGTLLASVSDVWLTCIVIQCG